MAENLIHSRKETLSTLRKQYVSRSADKMEKIGSLLSTLERTPFDRGPLKEVMRLFHGLAGSGTTYGFPRITSLGRQGEYQSIALIKNPGVAVDLSSLKNLLEGLRTELEAGGSVSTNGWEEVESRPGPRPFDLLVVGCDSEIGNVVEAFLEREAAAVRNAASEQEALVALADRIPDAVVIDADLPGEAGFEILKQLKNQPGGENIAVVMVGSESGFLRKVAAIRCGADSYYEKPCPETLTQRLSGLLERTKTERFSILSVEDEPEQAAFLRSVLESAGYRFRVCDEPQGFEQALIAFAPDLVLMDVVLPGASGYDLARYLRQDERYATLPVVFLTAQTQMQARLESLKAGADDHLVKPVAPGVLLSAVSAHIGRARFLKSLIDRDGLTTLLNYRAFLERAGVVVGQRLRNPDDSTAMAMIDLDHFKTINDAYGHQVGDRVLVSLSSFLRSRLRKTDTIGRLGGEEFAMILDHLQPDEAVRLLARLIEEFSATDHRDFQGNCFQVTLSAGIAILDPRTMDVQRWMKAADTALYEAKQAGRNCVKVFSH